MPVLEIRLNGEVVAILRQSSTANAHDRPTGQISEKLDPRRLLADRSTTYNDILAAAAQRIGAKDVDVGASISVAREFDEASLNVHDPDSPHSVSLRLSESDIILIRVLEA